jgi:hypothetical protein
MPTFIKKRSWNLSIFEKNKIKNKNKKAIFFYKIKKILL